MPRGAVARGGGALRRRADPRRGRDGPRRPGRAPRGVPRLPLRAPLPARDGRVRASAGSRTRAPSSRSSSPSSRRRTPSSCPASSSSGSSCGATRPSRSPRGCGGRRSRPPAFSSPLAAFAAVRLFALGGLVSRKEAFFELDNPLAPLPGLLRAANGVWLLLRYVAKTFVPLGLSADHSAHALDLITSLADPRAVAGLAGVAALAAAGLARHSAGGRSSPSGSALALGTFLPTSNVLFPIGTIYGDRLAYLPSAGLLAAAAGLVAALPASLRRLPRGAPRHRRRDVRGRHGRAERGLPRRRRGSSPTWSRRSRAPRAPGTTSPTLARQRGETSSRGRASRRRSPSSRATTTRGRSSAASRGRRSAGATPGPDTDERSRSSRTTRSAGGGSRRSRRNRAGSPRRNEHLRPRALRRFPRSTPLLHHRAAFLHDRRPARGGAERRGAKRSPSPAEASPTRARPRADPLGARARDRRRSARRAGRSRPAPGSLEARLFLAERYEAGGNAVAAAAELGRAVARRPARPEARASPPRARRPRARWRGASRRPRCPGSRGASGARAEPRRR